jgi:uncharacterized membrane protein
MEKVLAIPISEQSVLRYYWGNFREWRKDSLLFYPIIFMLGSFVLVWITRVTDIYLMTNVDLTDWWMARSSTVITITSSVTSSVLSLLAIGFSISIFALQMANQQYSPRVTSIFLRSATTKITISLIIGTFVYSFLVMIEVLRSTREEISIISLLTVIVLVFACLVAFIVFMKSVLDMIRVTNIITVIDENTQEAIIENLLPEEEYAPCQAISLEQPNQVIEYSRLSDGFFTKRYENGVLRGLEHSDLVEIATKHNCVLRIIPKFGDFINVGDPIVEVYGGSQLQPKRVLNGIYVETGRGIYQDPAFGIRMLVDIALQALSPAVNAPTTAHQVILRLTNLLALVAERPQHTGAYADEGQHLRLLYTQTTWEEFVDLTYNEIIHYGSEDPQTRRSLIASFDYLLARVPESHTPPIKQQKALLLSTEV